MDKNTLAVEKMKEGKIEEAAKLLNEAIEENPKDAIAYTNFGNLLAHVQDQERAIIFLTRQLI